MICGSASAQESSPTAGAAALPEGVTIADEEGMIVDNGALTLESLESIALSANPAIARAAALVNAARARALQVSLQPNPEVGFDFQQLGSDGLAEQYGVVIRQEFVRREKLRLNRSMELQRANRLQQELAAARQRVLTDVRIAYFQALRAERQVVLTRQLVDLAEQGVRAANELFEAKEVGRTDILQAELEVESASVLLRNAENRRLAVWRELSSITARRMEPQPLIGDITDEGHEIRYEEALAQLKDVSPEVAAIMAEIARAQCHLSRQQIETMPNVTLEGVINWRDNGIGGRADGNLAMAIPLPIWNKNQGGIREARHQLTAAQRELGQVQLSLQQRLAPVFQRYQNAKEQVSRYQDRILPKAAETLALTREIYELGEIGFVNLLTVQRTYANNQIAYLDALENLRVAEAEITGMLLSDSLRSR